MTRNVFKSNIKENRKDAVIKLTSSWPCGRQNMRDIKTLYLTAPISRIKTLRDDEGRTNKINVGQVLPDNQIKRHSRMSLSGIPTAFNNAQGRDPEQKRLRMTTYFKEEALNKNTFRAPLRSGFTLLELLIVVLIIGILAAVAVPQYQKAVEKARMAEAIILVRAIASAHQRYYLEYGEYLTQNDMDKLDIKIPGSVNSTAGGRRLLTKDWIYSPRGARIELAVAHRALKGKFADQYYIYIIQNAPNRIRCGIYNGDKSKASNIQKQLCASLDATGTL